MKKISEGRKAVHNTIKTDVLAVVKAKNILLFNNHKMLAIFLDIQLFNGNSVIFMRVKIIGRDEKQEATHRFKNEIVERKPRYELFTTIYHFSRYSIVLMQFHYDC